MKLAENGPWMGHAAELLVMLNDLVKENVVKSAAWPKAPNHLSNRLERLAPSAKSQGVIITGVRTKTGKMFTIRRNQEAANLSSPSSPDNEEGDDGDATLCPF